MKKKFKFNVQLDLKELVSVPFVNGILFAKVRLVDGGDFAELSPRVAVSNNRVVWDKRFTFHCKMHAKASTGVLETCVLRVSVRKEVKGGRIGKLGYVDINLAEFACLGLTPHRYLLQGYESNKGQDNSILQVSLLVSRLEGDMVFKRPISSKLSLPTASVVDNSTSFAGTTLPVRFSSEGLSVSALSQPSSSNISINSQDSDMCVDGQPIGRQDRASSAPIIALTAGDSVEAPTSGLTPRYLQPLSAHRLSVASSGSQSESQSRTKHTRHVSWDEVMHESVKMKMLSVHGETSTQSSSTENLRRPDSCVVPHQVSSKTVNTRRDANDVVEQLMTNVGNVEPSDQQTSQGLQLFVSHDGTALVAGKDLSRNPGRFVPVVVPAS